MLKLVDDIGGCILNGPTPENKREFTYIGARSSLVIDYVVVNDFCKECVINFEVKDSVNLDHMPLSVNIRVEERRRRGKKEEQATRMVQRKERICWDQETIAMFRETTDKMKWKEMEAGSSIKEK